MKASSFLLTVLLQIKKHIQTHLWLRLFGVYAFFLLILSFYFLIGNFTSTDDQFFNIRLADRLAREGFSVLSEFNDFAFSHGHPWVYNTLFYYLLIPFTWFEPLELGIKAFAVASLAATCTTIYAFLSLLSFKRAFLWTVTLLVCFFAVEDFAHLLMARAFVLAPALLLLILLFLEKKKYLFAGMISFLYVFLHTATSFFPLLLAVVYAAFVAKQDKSAALRGFGIVMVGLVMAFVCGFFFLPGFSQAMVTFFTTLQEIVLSFHSVSGQVKIDEGMESYPTTLFDIFLRRPFFGVVLMLLIVVQSVRLMRDMRKGESTDSPVTPVLFFMSLLFLLGSFFTRRTLDFLLVFGTVFIAFSLKDIVEGLKFKDARLYMAGLVVALGVAGSAHILALADAIASNRHYAQIEGAALWLRENTQAESIIFNPTINVFPTFYFYNRGHNRVIIGIEPRDMYKESPERYWRWYHLSNFGILCTEQRCAKELALQEVMLQDHESNWYRDTGAQAARIFREEFQTDTIIVRSDYTYLSDLLEKSGSFEQMYTTPLTKLYTVYRIKE